LLSRRSGAAAGQERRAEGRDTRLGEQARMASQENPSLGTAPTQADIERTEKFDFAGRGRQLRIWEHRAIFWGGVVFTLFHLAVLNFISIDEWLFRTWHVAGGSIIGFMAYAVVSRERGIGVKWWDWILVAGSVVCAMYITLNLRELEGRTGVLPTREDMLVGLLGCVLILEITRRTAGIILPLICSIFIVYAFVGPWMPGVLHHRGYGADDFFSFIYSKEGVFGMTTAASSQFIVLFVVFASFLAVSKVGDYFMNLSFAMFGWARGGPAKVAVVSGVLFGTISGSAVANVVASGTFTIPMMRRVGYSKESAAAIEATSSTGGQITPPVMGAGAFIMAELTGIAYSEIALAAIFPAILFYVANYAHVDIEAVKQNIRGLPRNELPRIKPMLANLALLVPMAILVMLLLSGYSVMAAGTWGIASAVPIMLMSHLGGFHSSMMLLPAAAIWILLDLEWTPNQAGTASIGGILLLIAAIGLLRKGPAQLGSALVRTGRDCVVALEDGAKQSLQLVAVCACAGIIVGVLGLTGLGGRFAQLILEIAGSSHFLALCFAMVIALILGMGMPTTAAYAIAAAVVAPGLQRIGIDPLTAHLFIFYFAVVSAITPPVALASFAAAALAQSDPWKTSFESVRYGIAAFLVPFMFYYHPEIIMRGEPLAIAKFITTAVAGIYLLALASEGWMRGSIGLPLRVVLLAASALLVVGDKIVEGFGLGLPDASADVAGIVIAVVVWLWRRSQTPERRGLI
jgi:TRAP transporter 4TM/12TM fusion protein